MGSNSPSDSSFSPMHVLLRSLPHLGTWRANKSESSAEAHPLAIPGPPVGEMLQCISLPLMAIALYCSQVARTGWLRSETFGLAHASSMNMAPNWMQISCSVVKLSAMFPRVEGWKVSPANLARVTHLHSSWSLKNCCKNLRRSKTCGRSHNGCSWSMKREENLPNLSAWVEKGLPHFPTHRQEILTRTIPPT